MTVWFTADLHLGHGNIIGYSERPFPDINAMDEALIERWNERIGPQDTVWVLGDVALGRPDDLLAKVSRLRGHKLLVAGNHDRCWFGRGESAEAWTQRYLDAGFQAVHQGQVALTVEGTDVTACHFPYRGDSHDEAGG